MKILVVMSDNRALDPNPDTALYNSFTAAINWTYCKKHGYDFRYYQPTNPNAPSTVLNTFDPNSLQLRHCAWAKLLVVLKALQELYDYIVYIDSDCVFKNHDIKIEDIILKHKSTPWNVLFFNNSPWTPQYPCSGFMVCKRSPNTIAFLHKWFTHKISSDTASLWNQLLASTGHFWDLGTHWEQDTLWLVLVNTNYNVCIDEDEVMFDEKQGQFLRHICHTYPLQERTSLFRDMAPLNYSHIIHSIPPISIDVSKL